MTRELSVYVHIPFCARKCLYCDFLSFEASDREMESYVNLLVREIKEHAIFYRDHRVVSVFFGGGTPSLLPPERIGRILEQLRKDYSLSGATEITLECNPGTADRGKLESYITYGINRLSIGLQSTENRELARIGRIHDYETFLDTWHAARAAGFRNMNIDLMAALPGQDMASYQKTLERTAALEPEHISAYSLMLEEGTPLYERQAQYRFPTEDEDREMYLFTGRYLEQQGYRRYEISNYAKEGFACRHNQVYWQRGDYAGFGLGASSMVRDIRWSLPDSPQAYRAYVENLPSSAFPGARALTCREQMEEFMFLGLRMMRGVNSLQFQRQFGQAMEEVYGKIIGKLIRQGLLAREHGYIRLTDKGIDVSNYVMAEFLLY